MSYRREKPSHDRGQHSSYRARQSGSHEGVDLEDVSRSADADRNAHHFERPRPERVPSGKPSRRSSGPKTRAPRNTPAVKTEPASVRFAATESSPPCDELRYTIPTIGNLIPDRDTGLFNHTAEGYLNLLEQCHAKMSGLDGKIQRALPLPVFVHNYTQLYHLHLLKIAKETGQADTWDQPEDNVDVEDMERLLNADTVMIPAEIYDWLKGVGRFKDRTGYDYAPNVPLACVPKAKRDALPGGDFGLPDATNHNAYEVSISPCVTKATVTALLNANQGPVVYQPLPEALTPQNATPTGNLLGYRTNLRSWHPETLDIYLLAPESWDNTPLGSRIGYNSVLWSKQTIALRNLTEKMDIKIGMPPIDKGSLSLYASVVYDKPDATAILRRTNGYSISSSDLDAQTLACVTIKSYRRLRTANAPGYCFVGPNNTPLADWEDHINESYNMDGPFAPSYGDFDDTLNDDRFRRELTEGRYELILDEISRLTVRK